MKLTGLRRGRSDGVHSHIVLSNVSKVSYFFAGHRFLSGLSSDALIFTPALNVTQTADEVHRSTYKGGSCKNLLRPNLSYTAPWVLKVKAMKVSAAIAR